MNADLLQKLLSACRRHISGTGFLATPIPGLNLVNRTKPENLRSFSRPFAAIVLQGRKRTLIGASEFAYGPGSSVVTCVDVPSETCVEEASPEKPYISAVIDIRRELIADLSARAAERGRPDRAASASPIFVTEADDALADCALRLVSLLDDPTSQALLAPILMEEFHARLLLSPLGAWLREACAYGSRTHQVAQAIAAIRAGFAGELRADELAGRVNMSPATFHRHFKSVTGVTPIQYQKIMRLYEARRLLASGQARVAQAAGMVGYVSSSQFATDYRKFFGTAPSAHFGAAAQARTGAA